MNTISTDFQLNLTVLKQCREQLGLSLDDVKKEVSSIEKIENGQKLPTYKQLHTLAKLYEVPRWVFITTKLPEAYQYSQKSAFRQFKNAEGFDNTKVRKIITRVERYRDLILELREEQLAAVAPFEPLQADFNVRPNLVVERVREWLSLKEPEGFSNLKKKLEERGVFVFLTSKHRGWSQIEADSFRGLCLTHERMPIIIINDADTKKAQSFTLIHELGHLLKGTMSIDNWHEHDSAEEKWCDELAGSVLMPENDLSSLSAELDAIKQCAKSLKVSPYACLVRAKQLGKIKEDQYREFESTLKKEYEQQKKKQKERSGGPSRNRVREVEKQFGNIMIKTVLTAWHNKEISLYKAAKLFDLKKPELLLELGRKS